MPVDILLSTYNGELYLEEQINSIVRQTFTSWILIIRDDGSTDDTRKIISKYCKQYPEKVREIADSNGNVGSSLSFALLLEQSKSKYIMFCDQDDVWLEDKIEITYNEITKLEKENMQLPLMIFTDLYVVDEELNIINNSFMNELKLFPDVINNIHKALALNVVAGCTIMINNKAKIYILPFYKYFIHDYWMAINIINYGKCKYLNKQTILYRQHRNNVYGTFKVNYKYFYKKLIDLYFFIIWSFRLRKHLSFKFSFVKYFYYKTIISIRRTLKHPDIIKL